MDTPETSSPESPDTKPPVAADDLRPPPIDWFLSSLVVACNTSGLEIGITLTVGGRLVSGQLVGGSTYFKGLAESIANARGNNGDLVKDISNAVAGNASIYETPDEATAGNPQFVHLKNAKHFDPSGDSTPRDGTWWRGRLSEVQGFSIGSLS
jgi:hypothetical protein